MAASVGDLLVHMKSMNNAVGVCKEYLKRQYNARLMRADNEGFKYPSIGAQFRAKNKKAQLKMTPSDNSNELEYLQALVILMMKADSRRGAIDHATLQLTGQYHIPTLTISVVLSNRNPNPLGLMRKVPTLNVQATNATALKLRKDLEDEVSLRATQADDPWLLLLTEAYVGKI